MRNRLAMNFRLSRRSIFGTLPRCSRELKPQRRTRRKALISLFFQR